MRTSWDRVGTRGQNLAVAVRARISQSSLEHLQHSYRKEVKMEQDKDQHLLCKQTGGLISFLVFKEFILQSSRSEMGAFYLCDGTSRAKEPASPLPG